MEEQVLSATLEVSRKGHCIAILDLESMKVETDLFFLATFLFLLSLKTLKMEARGELYIFVAHKVASTFGFPLIGKVSITHPQLFFFYF
jgi:3,4-dihydroxy-2-butanone 4-phosphate synthase